MPGKLSATEPCLTPPPTHSWDLNPGGLEPISSGPCHTASLSALLGAGDGLFITPSFPPHFCSSYNSSQNHLALNMSPPATLWGGGRVLSPTHCHCAWGQLWPPLSAFLCEMSLGRGGSPKKRKLQSACWVLTKNFTLWTSSSPQNSSRPAPPASSFFGGGGGGVFVGGSGAGSGTSSFSPFSAL